MQRLTAALDFLAVMSPSTFLRFTQIANASPGCGTQPDFVGETRVFDLPSGDDMRQYRIHLPKNYKVDGGQPLLLAYHGKSSNPEDFEIATRFSEEAVNPEMIVVYPAGIRDRWEGPSYDNSGVSDKLFTTDLVNYLKNTFCIDETRIYATGFSNGGGFVGTLACSPEHGGQFAGFAAFAAALYTDVSGDKRCSPARSPLPMLELHSLEDPVVPYYGGEGNGGPLPALPEWLQRWAVRNACTSAETSDLDVGGQHTKWACQGIDGALQHYNTTKLGHFWPAADAELDISPIIINFLSAQVRPP